VSTESRVTAVAWSKDDPFGAEYAEVAFDDDTLTARGIAIGSDPLPYRLDYSLRTGPSFVTAEVEVSSRGEGWKRSLKLVRSKAGEWNAETATVGEAPLPPPGGDTQLVDGALDPDRGLSPLFNSMPVLRHGVHDGGSVDDFLMVWISVPDWPSILRPSATRISRRSLTAIASSVSNPSVKARTSSPTSCSPPMVSSSTTQVSRRGFVRASGALPPKALDGREAEDALVSVSWLQASTSAS
jgi:uncharacterized protein